MRALREIVPPCSPRETWLLKPPSYSHNPPPSPLPHMSGRRIREKDSSLHEIRDHGNREENSQPHRAMEREYARARRTPMPTIINAFFTAVPAQVPLSLAVSSFVKGIPERGPLMRGAAGNAPVWGNNLMRGVAGRSYVSAERARFPSFWFADALASRRVFTF